MTMLSSHSRTETDVLRANPLIGEPITDHDIHAAFPEMLDHPFRQDKPKSLSRAETSSLGSIATEPLSKAAEKAIETGLTAFSEMYEREAQRSRRTRSFPRSDYEQEVSSLCANPRHPVVMAALEAMIEGQERPVISAEDVTGRIGPAALQILAERSSRLASVEEPPGTDESVEPVSL